MKALALTLALLSSSACAGTVKEAKDASLFIAMDDRSFCSATAVYSGKKPKATKMFLTAAHCVNRSAKVVRILFQQDGMWMEVDVNTEVIVKNDKDQALVRTNYPLQRAVSLTSKKYLKQGDRVKWWGSPAGLLDIYREGYVASVDPSDKGHYMLIPATARGDSGSGVFNSKNELVAVSSKVMQLETFSMSMVHTIDFTPAQIKQAQGY